MVINSFPKSVSMPPPKHSNRIKLKVHITQVLQDEDVTKRWIQCKGKQPSTDDVDRIHGLLISKVATYLKEASYVIDGKFRWKGRNSKKIL